MAAGSEQNFEVVPTTAGAEESEGDSCRQDMQVRIARSGIKKRRKERDKPGSFLRQNE